MGAALGTLPIPGNPPREGRGQGWRVVVDGLMVADVLHMLRCGTVRKVAAHTLTHESLHLKPFIKKKYSNLFKRKDYYHSGVRYKYSINKSQLYGHDKVFLVLCWSSQTTSIKSLLSYTDLLYDLFLDLKYSKTQTRKYFFAFFFRQFISVLFQKSN